MSNANLSDLRRRALRVGLDIAKYSPGDGTARYRFARVKPVRLILGEELPAPPLFHSCESPTLVGIGQVYVWIHGFEAGCYSYWDHEAEAESGTGIRSRLW